MAHDAWGVTVSVPMWRQFMIAAEAIEATAKAREAKLHPPKKAQIVPAGKAADDTVINVDSSDNGYSYNRRHRDSSQNNDDTSYGNDSGVDNGSPSGSDGSTDDSGAGSSTGSASSPAASDQSTGGGDDSSGTVSTPAPPTDSDSGTQSSPATPDNSGDNQNNATPPSAPAPAQPQQQNDDQQGYRQGSLPNSSGDTFNRHARLNDAVYNPSAKHVAARTVTVTVCSDTGLLATKWCPETVTETFAAGSQPHRRCTLHHAPSGE